MTEQERALEDAKDASRLMIDEARAIAQGETDPMVLRAYAVMYVAHINRIYDRLFRAYGLDPSRYLTPIEEAP
jgi:hypothetical protein